jgi:hypothetical protein
MIGFKSSLLTVEIGPHYFRKKEASRKGAKETEMCVSLVKTVEFRMGANEILGAFASLRDVFLFSF